MAMRHPQKESLITRMHNLIAYTMTIIMMIDITLRMSVGNMDSWKQKLGWKCITTAFCESTDDNLSFCGKQERQ